MNFASHPSRNKSATSVIQPTPLPPQTLPPQPLAPEPKKIAAVSNVRAASAQRHWLTWKGTPKPESSCDGDWEDETVSPAIHSNGNNNFRVSDIRPGISHRHYQICTPTSPTPLTTPTPPTKCTYIYQLFWVLQGSSSAPQQKSSIP